MSPRFLITVYTAGILMILGANFLPYAFGAPIAPGGNITSVVKETQRSGWPHEPTAREMADVATIALKSAAPRNTYASSRCWFGYTMGDPILCLVVWRDQKRVIRFGLPKTRCQPRVPGIFEDGSFRIIRGTPRRKPCPPAHPVVQV